MKVISSQSSCDEEVALVCSRSKLTSSLDCSECSVKPSKDSFIERDQTFMKGSELHNVKRKTIKVMISVRFPLSSLFHLNEGL